MGLGKRENAGKPNRCCLNENLGTTKTLHSTPRPSSEACLEDTFATKGKERSKKTKKTKKKQKKKKRKNCFRRSNLNFLSNFQVKVYNQHG
jgi:hypothetical protein